MGQPYDELLYSLIISQLKDDGFYEEADSLQRKVVNAVFNIEASRQLRRIVEIMSVTNGMSWRKLTTNAQCPQGVILNLKAGSESPAREVGGSVAGEIEGGSESGRGPATSTTATTTALSTAEQRIGDVREQRSSHDNNTTAEASEGPEAIKEETSDEQKWKREMEHMRFDFKLSRKVDFKIHNVDPTKKRSAGGGGVGGEEKGAQKRMKGPTASQGKFFHIKMSKDFSGEKGGAGKGSSAPPRGASSVPPPAPTAVAAAAEDPGDKSNLQDFLQKITIPMDKLN